MLNVRKKSLPLSFFVCLLFAVIAGNGISPFAAGPGSAVKAYRKLLPDGPVCYQYLMVNNSPHDVVAMRVGYDYYRGIAELHVLPEGWDFYAGLPRAACASPPGWQCALITQEESGLHFMEWRAGSARSALPPGKGVSGFSIILPQADEKYLTGHFDLILGDSTDVSGTIGTGNNGCDGGHSGP
ncbi:MAG: hypothetical protein M0Z59_06565 [Nitrospiraceae bacterium]|nr:hypothetical protein [Nitrospiraceae bacterium]